MNLHTLSPEFRRRLKELQEQHIRALDAGDVVAIERIQAELAELLKRRNGQEAPEGPTAPAG